MTTYRLRFHRRSDFKVSAARKGAFDTLDLALDAASDEVCERDRTRRTDLYSGDRGPLWIEVCEVGPRRELTPVRWVSSYGTTRDDDPYPRDKTKILVRCKSCKELRVTSVTTNGHKSLTTYGFQCGACASESSARVHDNMAHRARQVAATKRAEHRRSVLDFQARNPTATPLEPGTPRLASGNEEPEPEPEHDDPACVCGNPHALYHCPVHVG